MTGEGILQREWQRQGPADRHDIQGSQVWTGSQRGHPTLALEAAVEIFIFASYPKGSKDRRVLDRKVYDDQHS